MKHYDPSTDYGRYPTLAPLPEELLGTFARCEKCGGVDFRFRLPDWTAECKKCGAELVLPVPITSLHATPMLPKTAPMKPVPVQFVNDVLLRSDGTLRSPEFSNINPASIQAAISGWSNITSIALGTDHIVGLCRDGSVKAAGSNNYGQCNVQSWSNMIAIAAGYYYTVGLCADGTVKAVGLNLPTYSLNASDLRIVKAAELNGTALCCNVSSWKNITAIDASWCHTVALSSDGRVHAVGRNQEGQCNVHGWTGITAIAAGSYHTVGLRRDGTVCAVGNNDQGQCNVQSWRNIIAIATRPDHTLGLCADGTVKATGTNRFGPLNLAQWTNVASLFTHYQYSLGICADGTIVCTDPKRKKWIEEALA